MTTDSFIHALAALLPARASLPAEVADKLASSAEEYAVLAAEFVAIPHDQPHELAMLTHSDLDTLLSKYDVSRIAIMGDIQFYTDAFCLDDTVVIAAGTCGTFSLSEAGAIILNENSFEAPEFVCAVTLGDFYKVLIIFSEYYHQRLLNRVMRDDVLARRKYAEQAAKAAGAISNWRDYLFILNSALPLP